MRAWHLPIILVCSLILAGCATSPDPVATLGPSDVVFITKEVSFESREIRVDLRIPVIRGLKDEALQSMLNASTEGAALTFMANMTVESGEFAKEVAALGQPLRQYQLFTTYKVANCSDKVLSFYVDTYTFLGGAHGMTERKAYNYNLVTGSPLKLSDFFKSGTDYKSKINAVIRKEMSKRRSDFFWGRYMSFKSIEDDQPFYVENGGLVIYFALLEISPYARGIPEFRIPNTSVQGI